ncbi:hypothetical protein ABU614_06460 [Lysobacter firmicutimachus]|uniref:Uncharacterized protein n=2 Tax=Lysobacter TaxID=68 RepID=A0AAU8MW42_9GAMM
MPASARPVRRRLARLLLVASAASCAHAATAQMLVSDPGNLSAQIQQTGKDAIEFGKQAQRWRETVAHFRQQLIGLRRLNFAPAQMRDDFAARPDDYGLEDLCPSRSGEVRERLPSVLRQAAPDLNGPIARQQLAICQRLVLAENARYNESVRMLKTLIERGRQFQDIELQRAGVRDSPGDLAANDNEAQRFLVRSAMELDYWQARMKAYEDYIAALKWDQSRLARRAMRGPPDTGPGGRAVQAVALSLALRR